MEGRTTLVRARNRVRKAVVVVVVRGTFYVTQVCQLSCKIGRDFGKQKSIYVGQ